MINVGLRKRVRQKKSAAGPWTTVLSAMVVILLVFLVSMVVLVYRMSMGVTVTTSHAGGNGASGGESVGPNLLKKKKNSNNKVEQKKNANVLRAGSSHTWISQESQPFVSYLVLKHWNQTFVVVVVVVVNQEMNRFAEEHGCDFHFLWFGSCSLVSRPLLFSPTCTIHNRIKVTRLVRPII